MVHGQAPHLAARRPDGLAEVLVGPEIRVAPAVDRLLRVADQEETGPLGLRPVQGEPADDLALRGVGVLELVHEDLIELAP